MPEQPQDPQNPRNPFISALKKLPEYKGWNEGEIEKDALEVVNSKDLDLQTGFFKGLGGLEEYSGWTPDEIKGDVMEVMGVKAQAQPTPAAETSFTEKAGLSKDSSQTGQIIPAPAIKPVIAAAESTAPPILETEEKKQAAVRTAKREEFARLNPEVVSIAQKFDSVMKEAKPYMDLIGRSQTLRAENPNLEADVENLRVLQEKTRAKGDSKSWAEYNKAYERLRPALKETSELQRLSKDESYLSAEKAAHRGNKLLEEYVAKAPRAAELQAEITEEDTWESLKEGGLLRGIQEFVTVSLPKAASGSAGVLGAQLEKLPLQSSLTRGVRTAAEFVEEVAGRLGQKMERRAGPENQFLYDLGSGTGSIITAFATAVPVTFLGGPAAGIAAGFSVTAMLEGGLAYDEAKEYGLSKADAANIGLGVGVVNGVLEMLPVAKILRRTGLGGAVISEIKDEILKRGLGKTIGKIALEQGGSEAWTEFAQELSSLTAETLYKRAEDKPELKEWLERGGYSALLGAILGFAVGGSVTTIEAGGNAINARKRTAAPEGGRIEAPPGLKTAGELQKELPPVPSKARPPKPKIPSTESATEKLRRVEVRLNEAVQKREPFKLSEIFSPDIAQAVGADKNLEGFVREIAVKAQAHNEEIRTELTTKGKAVLEQAGVKPKSVVRGQYHFDDPVTGSTLMLPLKDVTPEKLNVKLKESRAKFAPWQMTRENYVAQFPEALKAEKLKLHETSVREAIEKGKRVGEDVRAAYTVTGQIIPAAEGGDEMIRKGNFFKQTDKVSCGRCAVNSVLSMYGKKPDANYDIEEGTSPKRITAELSKRGIETDPGDVTFENLQPKSIAYYPRQDHYVSIEEVQSNRVLVNDSSTEGPEWLTRKAFETKWLKKKGNAEVGGWILKTSGETEEKRLSSTQVNIPAKEAKPFVQFAQAIPETDIYDTAEKEFGREKEPHVTALFGLKEATPEQVKELVKDFGDVKLKLGKTSVFKNPEYDVLKVDVESAALKKLNKLLKENTEFESDFPDYKPHLTIAYLKPGTGKKYAGDARFEGKEFTVSELLFSDPDYKKTGISLKGETKPPVRETLPPPGETTGTKPETLTKKKLKEAVEAAPVAGLTLQEQKDVLLTSLQRVKTVYEANKEDPAQVKAQVEKLGLSMDEKGRVVIEIPGDGEFHTPLEKLDEYVERVRKNFPTKLEQTEGAALRGLDPDTGRTKKIPRAPALEVGIAGRLRKGETVERIAQTLERGERLTPEEARAKVDEVKRLYLGPDVSRPRVNRESVIEQFEQATTNLSPEQQAGWSAVVDAQAKQYVRENPGETVDDYYAKTFAGVEQGADLPENVLHQYIGENANLRDDIRENLHYARYLESQGKDAEALRLATGWFRSPYDSKWRFEIQTDELRLKVPLKNILEGTRDQAGITQPTDVKLSELIEFDKLFTSYPQLQDLRVLVSNNLGESNLAVFNRLMGTIILNGKAIQSSLALRKTLVHEIQHAIQYFEGFARGGNLARFLPDDYYDVLEQENQAAQKVEEFDEFFDPQETIDTSEKEGREFTKAVETLKDAARKRVQMERNAADQYFKLAGEIESRDIEDRLNFSPKQRRDIAPFSIENIAPDQAIVLYGEEIQGESAVSRDALSQQLVESIQSTAEGGSVEDVARAREMSEQSKDLFTEAQRKQIAEFLGNIKRPRPTYQEQTRIVEESSVDMKTRGYENTLKGLAEYSRDLKAGRLKPVQGKPEKLFQGSKGAVQFLEDGRAVIHALKAADFSTVMHETGHIFLAQRIREATEGNKKAAQDIRTVEEWTGMKQGDLSRLHQGWVKNSLPSLEKELYRKAQEKFARGFERYLAEGKAPAPALKALFEKFKVWLLDVYGSITDSEIDVEITPSVRRVFDRLLVGEQRTTKAKAAVPVNDGSVDRGEGPGKSFPAYYSDSIERKSINDKVVEATAKAETDERFVLNEKVRGVLNELGIQVAEKYVPKRYLGIFKHRSKNVRVQSLFDVFTATHEAAHAISRGEKIGERIIKDTGRGDQIRKRLTDIYVEFYPKAQRSHELEKRVEEGIAVLLENYFHDPVHVAGKYPDLVNTFLKPTGKYHSAKFTQLLDAMTGLVGEYSALTPQERIGSRIVRGEEVVRRDKGFSVDERLIYEFFNKAEPLMRYGRSAGVSGTWKDPFVHYFNILNRNTIINNWILGNNTLVLKKDGNWDRKQGTVKDYLGQIKGKEKEFDQYLVARRVMEDHNNLTEITNSIEMLKPDIDAEIERIESNGALTSESKAALIKEARSPIAALEQEAVEIRELIKRDAFRLADVEAVIGKFEPVFKKAVAVYDNVNKRLIDFMEATGRIDSERAETLRGSKAYASFQRMVTDELLSERPDIIGSTAARSKERSLKERTGSTRAIISPVFNQITAISEIIGKGLENVLWNKVYDLSLENTEIAQRFEEVETQRVADGNGRISYPQGSDPNLLKFFRDGKVKFVKPAPEFVAVAQNLKGMEWDFWMQVMQLPSAVFTRLTTSANPLFALGNLPVDQVSALIQSKSGYKPVIDPIRGFIQAIREYATTVPEGEQEFKKYLEIGGKRQTFARQYDVAPEKTITKITGGATRAEKAFSVIDSGLGILELPSNLSEYISRFGEFHRAKALGLSDSEALFRAAEVTVPFQLQGHLGGRFGQVWVKSIPYLNAALQVSYKFGRTTKENPGRVATISAGVLTAAFTTAIATMLIGSDEQKRYLANIPARELARAIYIPLPDGGFLRLRIPEQIGAFTGLAYLYVISHYSGQKVRFDEFLDATTAWIPDALDLTNLLKAPFLESLGAQILQLTPQVLKPGILVATNIRSYPEIAPLIPEYMKEEPPEYQYTKYTSEVAKTIGKMLGISPIQIEAWVRGQFGAVGGYALGKFSANPIYRQEEDYIMGGRAYNNFYREKSRVETQYKRLEYPNAFSDEEKEEIIERRALYENAAGVLKNLRKALQATETLPHSLRKDAFSLLIALDNGIDTESAGEMLADLNDGIQDYAESSGVDQERIYKTSPGKIDRKVAKDLEKFEEEEEEIESSILTRSPSDGGAKSLLKLLYEEEVEE